MFATSDITRVDDTHVSIVPPPSPPDQDNEGIALQLADSVTGTSPQHCAILLPTGCANQFFYLSEQLGHFTSPPLDLDLSLDLGGTQSAASKACGINGSTGTSSGLSANAGLHGGPVSVTAGYGVSKSSAGVPEAFVGSGTITVENAIEISVVPCPAPSRRASRSRSPTSASRDRRLLLRGRRQHRRPTSR